MFFIAWLVLAIASTICIWICDCTTNGYINMSIPERQVVDAERSVFCFYENIDLTIIFPSELLQRKLCEGGG